MKRWLVLVVTLFCWFARLFDARAENTPTITQPVTDLVTVLSQAQSEAIAARLERHREATRTQLAVLVVASTGGEPIEAYARRAATAWGGGERDDDRGALLVLALDDRKSRLEVGTGLEAELPEARSKALLEAARPQLRDKAYAAAIWAIADGVIVATGGASEPVPASMTGAKAEVEPARRSTTSPLSEAGVGCVVALYLALLAFRLRPFGRSRRPGVTSPDGTATRVLRFVVGATVVLLWIGVVASQVEARPFAVGPLVVASIAGVVTAVFWESRIDDATGESSGSNLASGLFLGVAAIGGLVLFASASSTTTLWVDAGVALVALPLGTAFSWGLGSPSTATPTARPRPSAGDDAPDDGSTESDRDDEAPASSSTETSTGSSWWSSSSNDTSSSSDSSGSDSGGSSDYGGGGGDYGGGGGGSDW